MNDPDNQLTPTNPVKPAETAVDIDLDAAIPLASQDAIGGKEDKTPEMFNAARPDAEFAATLASKSTADELLEAIINAPTDQLIPWEEVNLPSRGLYYDGQIPGGVVKIKAMGTHADKILATARLAQTGQSMDYLFENCVQLPSGFMPTNLLAGDRTFLLYALRGITHDNMYEFMIGCPNCDTQQNAVYDLNELGNTITYGNPNVPEPSRVLLPYLSEISKKEVWVTVRFLRGNDVSQLAQRQRFNKRLGGATIRAAQPKTKTARGQQRKEKPVTVDQTLTDNLNLIVTSFMGTVTDPVKIKALIEKLHSSDTAAIREFLKKNSPGIDTSIQVTCIECNTEFRTELPITESFFRPSDSRRV